MIKEYYYKNFPYIAEAMKIYNTTMPGPNFTLLDFNILCLIKSFHISGKKFYITNDQLAAQLLSSEKSVRRSIDRLCEAQLIRKELINGKRNNGRYLIYQPDKINAFISEMQLLKENIM